MAEPTFMIPGDDSLQAPYWWVDQEIEIAGAPSDIWPWLAQMGDGRAGWYSYDWIDNLGRQSFTHVEESLQNIEVGQKISIFKVEAFAPEQLLTLRFSKSCNMTWFIEKQETSSRLITRLRVKGPSWLLNLSLAPGHFIMQRKQFIEIKKRVESRKFHSG